MLLRFEFFGGGVFSRYEKFIDFMATTLDLLKGARNII